MFLSSSKQLILTSADSQAKSQKPSGKRHHPNNALSKAFRGVSKDIRTNTFHANNAIEAYNKR